MPLLNVLTVILLALRIIGIITCSWWLVFLPSIIYVGIVAGFWLTAITIAVIAGKWSK